MYVSLTLVYVGVSLATNAGWPLVLVVVPVAIVNFYIIPREEEHLLTRFGPEYEAFRREVRRWL